MRMESAKGDIVQIDFGKNGSWDHSMVIINKEYSPDPALSPIIKVAAHTRNCYDDRLIDHFDPDVDVVRFISISGYYD